MALVPTFVIYICIILFGLTGIVSLMFALGVVKQARALMIALGAAVAVVLVAVAVAFVGAMLMDTLPAATRRLWFNLNTLVIYAITTLVATAATFVIVLVILLRRPQPSLAPIAGLRRVPLIISLVSVVVVLFNAYQLIPPLHPTWKLIRDAHGMRSAPACYELSRRGEGVIPVVLDTLAADPHANHAYVFADVVGRIPGEAATEALLSMLDHPNPNVRAQAAWQLGLRKEKRALDALLEVLEEGGYTPYHRARVIDAITRMEDPSVVPRILAIMQPSPAGSGINSIDYPYDANLISAMGQLKHPQAYEFLIELCSHPDVQVRREAVRALSNYPCRRTAVVLIGLLDDPETSVRGQAHWIATNVVGLRWDPSDIRYSKEDHAKVRDELLEWMEKNGDTLPAEPSYGE